MVTGAVTSTPGAEPPLTEDMHLGWDSQETCDGCGAGVAAIWLVFTDAGPLTFCGKHYRDFCRARKAKT